MANFRVSVLFFLIQMNPKIAKSKFKIARIATILENLTSVMCTMGAAFLGARKSMKTW